jgi:hypothetical protein
VHSGLGFFFYVPVLEKSFTSPFMGSNSDLFRPMESPRRPCDSDFEFEFEFGNTGKCASLDHGSSVNLSLTRSIDRCMFSFLIFQGSCACTRARALGCGCRARQGAS